jgi:UDP-N-acetylmuramoyl-L-alanyl-D-glutamate--2,6-diaminopimelate ligase
MMGTVASKFADVRIITNDNPRNEEPQHIIAEILGGMNASNHDCHRACCGHRARHRFGAATLPCCWRKGMRIIRNQRREHSFSDVAIAEAALRTWRAPA